MRLQSPFRPLAAFSGFNTTTTTTTPSLPLTTHTEHTWFTGTWPILSTVSAIGNNLQPEPPCHFDPLYSLCNDPMNLDGMDPGLLPLGWMAQVPQAPQAHHHVSLFPQAPQAPQTHQVSLLPRVSETAHGSQEGEEQAPWVFPAPRTLFGIPVPSPPPPPPPPVSQEIEIQSSLVSNEAAISIPVVKKAPKRVSVINIGPPRTQM